MRQVPVEEEKWGTPVQSAASARGARCDYFLLARVAAAERLESEGCAELIRGVFESFGDEIAKVAVRVPGSGVSVVAIRILDVVAS